MKKKGKRNEHKIKKGEINKFWIGCPKNKKSFNWSFSHITQVGV